MKRVFKTLNSVQTELLTWGDPFNSKGSDVIICFTGNPGIPDFYIEFAAELHKNTALPVCVIGQAGHTVVTDKQSNVLKNRQHLYNLEGQLQHKLDLLDKFIDKESKLHLIGHSIGAWLITELIHRHDTLIGRVSSIQLLFPTLQKMAESRNGKFFNGIVRRVHSVVMMFFILLNLFPHSWLSALASLYLKYNSLPAHYNSRILKYLDPRVFEKVLFLAYNEMDKVRELNKKAIDKIKHLTNVIYSTRDGWAPLHYMDDLKMYQPELKMREVNIRHAFVLKSSEKVAEMTTEFIKHTRNSALLQ